MPSREPQARPLAGMPDTASPTQGGTVTVAYQMAPGTLDPAVAWELTEVIVIHAIYQGLFRYAASDGQAGTRLEPCLAAEMPTVANGGLSDGGCTPTIRLRDDVRFQPPLSRPVTADDFKYSFERMMNPRTTPLAPATDFYLGVVGARRFRDGGAANIDGYEVLDPLTLRIRLERPDPAFLHVLTLDFCDVVPREWVEKTSTAFSVTPLGTGPFVFAHLIPGREVVLRRNPTYWETGLPHLDELKCEFGWSQATALRLLEEGTIDALGDGLPADELAATRNDPRWAGCVHRASLVAGYYLFLNVGMPPLDDVRVRQAIAWAIDRDKIVDAQAGDAEALYQLYPPGLPGHEAGKKYCGYDPARARKLLEEAGRGSSVDLRLYADNVDPGPRIVEVIAADLEAVGIHTTVAVMAPKSFASLQTTPRSLAAGIYAWWMDFPDPANWIMPLFTKGSAMNSTFWSSPRLEVLLADAQATPDPELRLAKYREMQEHVMAEVPYVPLSAPVRTTLCAPHVGGFYVHPVYELDPARLWRRGSD
jgi:oligopeptide transport system substrate-binding protein